MDVLESNQSRVTLIDIHTIIPLGVEVINPNMGVVDAKTVIYMSDEVKMKDQQHKVEDQLI